MCARRDLFIFAIALFMLVGRALLMPGSVTVSEKKAADRQLFILQNEAIRCTVTVSVEQLRAERIETMGAASSWESDAGFALEVMWTDWRAPGKDNNADNLVTLTNADFKIARSAFRDAGNGAKELDLYLQGAPENPLQVVVSYRLAHDAFFIKRKISVSDARFGHHFLHAFIPLQQDVSSHAAIIKAGGFGQPIALTLPVGGAFCGVESPAASNTSSQQAGHTKLYCRQEIGERIGKDGIASDWAVLALTPDQDVKKWFGKYVDSIRVMPLRPYTLYNSWYDLRAPEYAKSPDNVMNEANVKQIISLLQDNMIRKYAIGLDAFVLDDGWDTYASDWQLRAHEFPNGLLPIATELQKLGTTLGVWFGPTGGYSFRMKRIDWMRQAGYEVVGESKDEAMLCLAGTKYKELLRRRTTDMVEKSGVGYFKWDGIQFSCSEPDHGHAVGVYSRRAILNALCDMCRAVRAKKPDTFLNITSGTWLSPWWLQYANQIWMDAEDYGFADVPSISRRDSAITYRDAALYEKLTKLQMWMPIANLMTHGLIKGKEFTVGGVRDPLDKFTDDMLFYVARGISMYELYISPAILSDGEWQAIAASLRWAKDRFAILQNTEMIGGDPVKGEAYGYIHGAGNHAIIAGRNPVVSAAQLTVKLDTAQGLANTAKQLVVERVYPSRLILPGLYRTGDTIMLDLDGFVTAVYEIYPLSEAPYPLISNTVYTLEKTAASRYTCTLYRHTGSPQLLNGAMLQAITTPTGIATSLKLPATIKTPPAVVHDIAVAPEVKSTPGVLQLTLSIDDSARAATLALLCTADGKSSPAPLPVIAIKIDGTDAPLSKEEQESSWAWHSADIAAGKHTVEIICTAGEKGTVWRGNIALYFAGRQALQGEQIMITSKDAGRERAMPPLPYGQDEWQRYIKLAARVIQL